jgi:hypothetical protein
MWGGVASFVVTVCAVPPPPVQALASAMVTLGWPDAPVLLTPILRPLLADPRPFAGPTARVWACVKAMCSGGVGGVPRGPGEGASARPNGAGLADLQDLLLLGKPAG